MSKKKKFSKLEYKSISTAYGLLTTLAINLIVIIAGMFFLGNFLDKIFGTSPLFLFISLLLGLGACFRNLYVLSMKSLPKPKQKYEYKEKSEESSENEWVW